MIYLVFLYLSLALLTTTNSADLSYKTSKDVSQISLYIYIMYILHAVFILDNPFFLPLFRTLIVLKL